MKTFFNLLLSVAMMATAPAAIALTGDVNGDNLVNGTDVTALYEVLLNQQPSAGNADVNGDGVVNGTDVTVLYNLLLNPVEVPTMLAGGDISMLPLYEQKGAKYYDPNGKLLSSITTYFKEQGWNAMRVRLFVNPANASASDQADGVVQDLDYVKQLGKRIKDEGFQFMLDFHYSDSWADPAHQSLPADWKGLSVNELQNKIYEYTCESLEALIDAGATPDLIQIGNEITYGMLWQTAHIYPGGGGQNGGTWDNFTSYLKMASKACREKCPNAKIVVHTEMGNYDTNVPNFYNTLKPYGLDYDAIGISYYPAYHRTLSSLETVLSRLEKEQEGKDIMIVETGYSYQWAMNDTKYDHTATWPYTADGQALFASQLVEKLKSHSAVKGVFWWWPEANEYGVNWQNPVTPNWWNASLINNNTGRALPAIAKIGEFAQ